MNPRPLLIGAVTRTRASVTLVSLLALTLPLSSGCGGGSEDTTVVTTERRAPATRWVDDPAPVVDAGPRTDASTCPADTVDYRAGSYLPRRPPRDSTTACAPGQVTTIVTPCELDVGVCGDFPATLAPCLYCLFGRESDASYGLRVAPNPTILDRAGSDRDRLNVRGYTLRVGGSETCGNALEDYLGCLDQACVCAPQTRLTSCLSKAAVGACNTWGEAVDSICATGASKAAATLLRPVIERGQFASESEAATVGKSFCGGS